MVHVDDDVKSSQYLPHEKDNTRSAHTFSGMTASDHDLERGVGI